MAAQHPARQLNSKTIKDAATSYVIPVVQKRFCVVSASCVWRVEGSDNSTTKAWELICDKRAQCDNKIENVPGVAFFFSSITSREARVKDKAKSSSDVEADEVDVHEDVPCSQTSSGSDGAISTSSCSAIKTAVEKGRLPTILYWIAFESRNGAPVSLVHLHRQLLECEVEINTKVLTTRSGAPGEMMKNLCTVLKDHSSSYVNDIVETSSRMCTFEAVRQLEGGDGFQDDENELYSERPLRFVAVKKIYANEIEKMVKELIRAGLKLDVDGVEVGEENETTHNSEGARTMTTDPCTQLINDIEYLMNRLGYAIHEGTVFKKEGKAKYTYAYKCEISAFIGTLEGNESFKPRLVKYGDKVKEKLQNARSQVIRQIKIDYDLIEVSNGWCLSLSLRKFVAEAIPMERVGRVTPRAFFEYDHTRTPDGKYFREILENSLEQEQIKSFCNEFVQLLQFNSKRHKQKVPCLVGEANSGKTSLFAPVLGVVRPSKIAKVTKQKHFNKAMIDETTEIIFIDEATVGIMDIDDWKLLTQGGWTAHDKKFTTAKGFINRCPMLITCQRELVFPVDDREAMEARLSTYHFKTLKNKDPNAYGWLKSHPVDCIVWAIANAGQPSKPSSTTDRHQDFVLQGALSELEESQLYSFNLEEVVCSSREPSTSTLFAESCQSQKTESGSIAEQCQDDILRALKDNHPRSFRGRVYKKLMERVSAVVSAEKEEIQLLVESRRRRCIKEGIADEREAAQLIDDPFDPLPTQLQERRMARLAKEWHEREVREGLQRKEEATSAYSDPWVLKTEKEMFELCKRLETTRDEEMRKVLSDLVDITENKLKDHHRIKGTTNSEALAERKRVSVALGHVPESIVDMVKTVYTRLPVLPTSSPSYAMTPPSSQRHPSDSPEVPPKTPSCNAEKEILTTEGLLRSPLRLPLPLKPPKTPSWSPRHWTSVLDCSSPFRVTTWNRYPNEVDDGDDQDMFITPKSTPSHSDLETPKKKKRKAPSASQRVKKVKGQSTQENTLERYFFSAKK